MIFWSLVFLVISLIVLIKGNLMNDFLATMKVDDFEALDTDSKIKLVLKTLYTMMIFLILTLVWLIYLIKALAIDIYTYPTLFFIGIFLYGIIKGSLLMSKGKNKDTKPVKKRTFIRTMQSILKISYICYILWLLLF